MAADCIKFKGSPDALGLVTGKSHCLVIAETLATLTSLNEAQYDVKNYAD